MGQGHYCGVVWGETGELEHPLFARRDPDTFAVNPDGGLFWLAERHRLPQAAEASARIERAVDKVYAGGIKPFEFGGSSGTIDVTTAILAAL